MKNKKAQPMRTAPLLRSHQMLANKYLYLSLLPFPSSNMLWQAPAYANGKTRLLAHDADN